MQNKTATLRIIESDDKFDCRVFIDEEWVADLPIHGFNVRKEGKGHRSVMQIELPAEYVNTNTPEYGN